MNILVDTHTLFWFLTADKRLSSQAKEVIEQAHLIFVPIIVLLELLYLFQKKGEVSQYKIALKELKNRNRFSIVSLDLGVAEDVIKMSSRLEIHDAAIVATAQILKVSIVTRDRAIRDVYRKSIW